MEDVFACFSFYCSYRSLGVTCVDASLLIPVMDASASLLGIRRHVSGRGEAGASARSQACWVGVGRNGAEGVGRGEEGEALVVGTAVGIVGGGGYGCVCVHLA